VRPRQEPDDRLLALAQAQSGVITLGQAADLGVGPWAARRLANTHWQRVAPGVFYLGLGAPPWLAQAWAGLLIGGPQARIAGASAAHLHGLEREPPPTIEVLVPLNRQLRDRWPWIFRRERPGARDPRSVGVLSRTTVEDTVLDLVDRATTAGEVQGLIASAVQQRRTTVVRLRRAAANRGRLRHRRLVDALLDDVAVGAETPLEIAYLHKVERAHDLPRGVRQHRARHSAAVRDVVYEEFALVVELDGRMGHEGAGRFRDLERDNAAAVAGELTLRYGWHDVEDRACVVAFQLAAVLARRGWDAEPRRCGRCQRVVGPIV
jgi:predicted transcriptional regulator of viral defense system/very-short-patch-repair endonuclease